MSVFIHMSVFMDISPLIVPLYLSQNLRRKHQDSIFQSDHLSNFPKLSRRVRCEISRASPLMSIANFRSIENHQVWRFKPKNAQHLYLSALKFRQTSDYSYPPRWVDHRVADCSGSMLTSTTL